MGRKRFVFRKIADEPWEQVGESLSADAARPASADEDYATDIVAVKGVVGTTVATRSPKCIHRGGNSANIRQDVAFGSRTAVRASSADRPVYPPLPASCRAAANSGSGP
jgi:hypothetical protein